MKKIKTEFAKLVACFNEVRRLRIALRKYGRHDSECPASWIVVVGKQNTCRCGLAKSFLEAKSTEGKEK